MSGWGRVGSGPAVVGINRHLNFLNVFAVYIVTAIVRVSVIVAAIKSVNVCVCVCIYKDPIGSHDVATGRGDGEHV